MSSNPRRAACVLGCAPRAAAGDSATVVAVAALLSRRSDRDRRRHVAGRVEGDADRGFESATTSSSTRSRIPENGTTCAPGTSTPSTRCPTRAGSSTGSAAGRSRPPSSFAGPIGSSRSRSTDGRSADGKSLGPAAGLPHDGSVGPAVSNRVRSAVESRDGDRRGDHRHGVLSCVRVPHRRGLPRRTRSGEDRDRTRRAHYRIRSSASAGGSRAATWTTCCAAARGCRTAATAFWPAASPTARRSATFATTAPGPTTRTTSFRTKIGASCARRACSARGSITTTRAA